MKFFSDAVEMNMYKRMLNEWYGAYPMSIEEQMSKIRERVEIGDVGDMFNREMKPRKYALPPIKDVIFNRPATIVFWADNTKTVVKCGENDVYDPEKGLAMAIVKKVYGNKGNYYNLFSEWVEPELKYYSKDE